MKAQLARLERFFVHNILHVDDTPHRIALGVAIGIFVAWTPLIGLHMVLAVTLASVLRANKAVPLPLVWISNPLTIVPVYLPSYLLGRWLLGGRHSASDFRAALALAVGDADGWWEHVRLWWNVMEPFLAPLWVGSLVIGLALALTSYALVYYLVWAVRRMRNYRGARRQQRFLSRQAGGRLGP